MFPFYTSWKHQKIFEVEREGIALKWVNNYWTAKRKFYQVSFFSTTRTAKVRISQCQLDYKAFFMSKFVNIYAYNLDPCIKQNIKLYILVMNFCKTFDFFPCAEKIHVNLVIFFCYRIAYFFLHCLVSYFIKLTLNSWNYFQAKGDQDSTPKTSTNNSFSKYYKKICLTWHIRCLLGDMSRYWLYLSVHLLTHFRPMLPFYTP